MSLIRPLFGGELDIIGDVHGEIGALGSLLSRMGYDGYGNHPEGRRLVFVGDIIDRGPDSIAVLRLVKSFVENNRAQCILGNHEFNLLRPDPYGGEGPPKKNGNHWFHGIPEAMVNKDARINFQRLANEKDRMEILDFLNTLPVALEREDLRVVHACWSQEDVEKIRNRGDDVRALFIEYDQKVLEKNAGDKDKIRKELRRQNDNPLKVLTSGIEEKAKHRYWAGGKERILRRSPWWKTYSGPITVVGHYWRTRKETDVKVMTTPDKKDAPKVFEGYGPFDWLGNVMCIDYSVGRRYFERHKNLPEGDSGSYLCAFRTGPGMKKNTLLFDDGFQHQLPDIHK